MSAVLGIDPSATSTGFVYLDHTQKPVYGGAHRPTKLKGMLRAESHANALLDLLGICGNPSIAVLETPFTSRNPKTFSQLVEVQTLLRYILWKRDVKTLLISPSSLKQWVGVKAKKGAGKDPIRQAVKEHYGFEHKIDDVVDAFVLAQIGFAQLNLSHCAISSEQRDVLAKASRLQ